MLYGGRRLDLLGQNLQTQNGFNTAKLLSLKPVVFIGLISYSLYLWHWVVLAVMRYVYMDNALPMSAIVLAVVLMSGLSVLSYYFVETPARRMKNFTTPKIHRGNRRLFRPADSCRRLPADCQTGRIRGKPIYG